MLQAIIILLGVGLDQLTKWWAVGVLRIPGNSITVIPGILDFTYVQNKGAAFGLMESVPWLIFAITALLTIGGIVYMAKHRNIHVLLKVAIALIIAGGLGNVIDRLFLSYVRDFIEFTFVNFYVFNVADICVTIGGALFILYLLFIENRRVRPEEQPAEGPALEEQPDEAAEQIPGETTNDAQPCGEKRPEDDHA